MSSWRWMSRIAAMCWRAAASRCRAPRPNSVQVRPCARPIWVFDRPPTAHRHAERNFLVTSKESDMSYNQKITLGGLFDIGLAARREVLGAAYVDKSMEATNDFMMSFQHIT